MLFRIFDRGLTDWFSASFLFKSFPPWPITSFYGQSFQGYELHVIWRLKSKWNRMKKSYKQHKYRAVQIIFPVTCDMQAWGGTIDCITLCTLPTVKVNFGKYETYAGHGKKYWAWYAYVTTDSESIRWAVIG